MRTFTSADAKNHFGELIDKALAAPVAITKYDRTVVAVLAVEEYELLKALVKSASAAAGKRKARK